MKKEKVISIIVTLILMTTGFILIKSNNHLFENNIDEISNEILKAQSSLLENTVLNATSSAIILGKHIELVNGETKSFKEFANTLLKQYNIITNLQLAKNGIVSHIHPLKGHKKALGHNIFKDDKRKKEAFIAKRSKTLTLAGPFNLIQGGVAIIARKPIYINNQFWGFSSALILMKDLLEPLKIDKLKEQGYILRISRMHPDTKEIDYFFNENNFSSEEKYLTKTIIIPNGKWYLDIQYKNTFMSNSILLVYSFINILISILLGLFLYIILKKPKNYIEV